jgi:Fe-S cluster assembly iron-binding protein IscA
MLTITEDAARLLRTLTEDAALPEGAGVRIVVDPTHHSLSMGFALEPEPHDIVVATRGARVFLPPSVAQRLRRRTLQADVNPDRALLYLDR